MSPRSFAVAVIASTGVLAMAAARRGVTRPRVRDADPPVHRTPAEGGRILGPSFTVTRPAAAPGAGLIARSDAPDPSIGAAPGPPIPDPSRVPVRDPSAAPSPPSGSDAFRPDVEGLRGVAILLVLLFHGGLPLAGGFVGVDVFFVISGFLIAGLLFRELGRTGTIALDRFYARRIRRLLPAAAVALAVTLPLSYAVLAPLDRAQAMEDGTAAMLSVANIRFALADGDYFTAVAGPSPFLHFWSLSLEEQFYLVWPVLLLVVARGRRPRLVAGLALAVVVIASFAVGVALTDLSTSWAFYSLPARAWQFAVGGLLALAAGGLLRIPRTALVVAGWTGAALLVACAATLDGSVAYPGLAAAAPTVATVLLIASGQCRLGPGLLLTTPPLRFFGRISYSLYLWHWPLLVLPMIAAGAPIELPAVALLSAVAVGVAWCSERFVERPFRRPVPREPRAVGRSLAFGGATIVTVIALAGSLNLAAARAIDDPGGDPTSAALVEDVTLDVDAGPVATIDAGDGSTSDEGPAVADIPPTAAPSVTAAPSATAAADSPTPVPSAGAAAVVEPAVSSAPDTGWTSIPRDAPDHAVPLPRRVRPSLARARGDIERLFADGCITNTFGTRPVRCVYGDEHGSVTVALVGDSHAGHWFPAFNVLAERHGWRLLPYVKVSCPFVDMPVRHLTLKRTYTECATWRDRVIDRLNREQPDLVVVVSGYRAIIAARSADARPERQGAAMGRAVARLEMPAAIMIDSPRVSWDIPACLSRHQDDVRACAIGRNEAFPRQFAVRERLASAAAGVPLIDLVPAVCPATPCQTVRDGRILYRDGHHLTATFVRSLAGDLDVALAPLLAGPPPATRTSTRAEQPVR